MPLENIFAIALILLVTVWILFGYAKLLVLGRRYGLTYRPAEWLIRLILGERAAQPAAGERRDDH
jgi:hypothetical protein